MCPKSIEVELTDNAVNRMRACGCTPVEIIQYLYSGIFPVAKTIQGFEISIPFKGRLVGALDRGVFVAETFLRPFHRNKEYYYHDQTSRNQFSVTVSLVRRSGLRRILISHSRTIMVSLSEFGTTESEKPHIIPITKYAGE